MLNRPVLTLLFTALLIGAAALAAHTISIRNAELYDSQRLQFLSEAHAIKAQIDKQLTHNTGTIDALSGIIALNPGLNKNEFPTLIKNILPSEHSIMEVQLTKGTVVTYLSELPDRFNSLGSDLAKHADQKETIEKNIEERRLHFVGPFTLLNTNKNIVVARQPIFTGGQFFGFALYLIDFDSMMTKIQSEHPFSLRAINGPGDSSVSFGQPELFKDKNSVVVDMPFSNGGWQLAVQFRPTPSSREINTLIYGFSFLFALGCGALITLAQKFKNISIRDPLTGAFNRRYMDQAYKKKQYRYALYLDLDQFKTINDTYGHDIGDIVLEKFVNSVKNLIRHGDIVARLGGEEFLIMLENDRKSVALTIAERIREATEKLKFRKDLRLTTSIGVTNIRPEETLHALLQRADALLYRAKNRGPNTVEYEAKAY
jgi:diguanylate cyclase (GGDEF)-like protein